MKQFLLALLVLGASASFTQAQQPWAEKMFKQGTTHDFGTVPRGSQLLHRFTMTNIYAVKLQITEVRASCGCVTVTPSSRVLEPRGTVTFEVSMDTRRFAGAKTVAIHVSVGPEFISTAELKVSANSRNDVVFNPGQLNFGVVSVGQTPSETIDLEYAGSLDWRLTEVLANGAPVDLSFKELYRRSGQVGYQVKATLKADAPSGVIKQPIILKTNDPTSPTVSVLVEANVQATLSVSPGILRLGAIKPNEVVTRKIVIQGKKPFRLTGVEGMGEGITLAEEFGSKVAAVQTITFKVQLNVTGDFRREIHIKTDLQETPVTLVIEGSVSP